MNQLVQQMRARVDQQLRALRQQVSDQLAYIHDHDLTSADYYRLSDEQRATIHAEFARYIADVQHERRLLQLQQYIGAFRASQLPGILSRIHHMANPPVVSPSSSGTPPPSPTQVFIHASTIRVAHANLIEDEQQLDAYLAQMRMAYLAALKDGKKITL